MTEQIREEDREKSGQQELTSTSEQHAIPLYFDQSGLARALDLALSGIPRGEGANIYELVAIYERPSFHSLRALISEHLNADVDQIQLQVRDLILSGLDGARYLIPLNIGWISISQSKAILITQQGEKRLKLNRRVLKSLLGRGIVDVIRLEPLLNLERLRSTDENSTGVDPWYRLWNLLALEKPILRSLIVYAVMLGAMSLAVPVSVQVLVNTIAMGSLLQPLIILSVLLLGALTLSGSIYLIEHYAVELLQRRLFVRVAEDLSRRLVELTDEARERVLQGRLTHRFFEVITLQKSASKLLMDGVSVALQTLVGMTLLGFYHPALLAFDFVLIVALVGVLFLGYGAVESAVDESAAKYKVAQCIEAIAAGELDSHASIRLADIHTRTYLGARRTHYRTLFRQLTGGVLIQVVALVSLLGLGGWLVMKGELTLGQLVAAELVVGSVGASFVKLGKMFESAYDLLASLDKLGGLIDLPKRAIDHTSSEREVSIGQRPASALAMAGSIDRVRRGTFWLEVIAVLTGVLLLFSPWQQSVTGDGRVIAYAPLDRQQSVEAPLMGRVVKWHVQEGSEVKEGDVIAEISDNDPEILDRLNRERAASQAQVDAASLSITLTEARITSEESARESTLASARLKVKMAKDRKLAAERSVDAAKAAKKTAQLNLRRVKRLQKKGLSSRRDLELAELESQKAVTGLERARAAMRAAIAEVGSVSAERDKLVSSTRASVDSIRSSLEKLKAERAKAEAELIKVEVRLARQSQMQVLAPRDGTILRLIAKQGTEMVKAGDPLVTLVPNTGVRAVELFVDGNDAPLLDRGREVRLQFEGWPAVQFVGWPSVAVGTFGGVVDFIDSHGDERGRFRVVITPQDDQHWPEGRYLRQGVRASGWVLLNQVSLGYELWRQFNGFPPSLRESGDDTGSPKKAQTAGTGK